MDDHVLAKRIPDRRALKFIDRFVNARDRTGLHAVEKGFPAFLEGIDVKEAASPEDPGGLLQALLRHAWEIEDLRERRYALYGIREALVACYLRSDARRRFGPGFENWKSPELRNALIAAPHPFEQALDALQEVSRKMSVCRNPECQRRRFFLAERKNQKHCSTDCARYSQRESKRKWWSENGRGRRTARKVHQP